MLVIPAIDIKGGKCVRLLQGDPERETVYSDSPVDMAKRFQELGAKLIHVVDLDGAFDGRPVNMNLVLNIARSLSIPIEIGGGIRNADTIKAYLDAGIKRIILGSAVLEDSFGELIRPFTENIIVGIDARDGRVAVKGWKDVSDLTVDQAFAMVMERGLSEIIYTDISTDGMLGGPNIPAYEHILDSFPGVSLIASGGVSSVDDLAVLSRLSGIRGAITGKAVYDGRIDLVQAFERFN